VGATPEAGRNRRIGDRALLGRRRGDPAVGASTARYGVVGSNAVTTSAEQVAYWNGPVGERWVREQEALDRAFATHTQKLFEVTSLRPGQRVLDVGCGCGTTALAAADAVGPEGAVVGIDVSQPMLARARERSTGRANIAYTLGDAATCDFDGTFDVELSRFGVMFFSEPTAAMEHLRGALRPGGALAFMCWRAFADNAWVRVPYEAASPHLPPQTPSDPEEPGPFAFADGKRVERILYEAGFSKVEVVPFDADVVLSDRGVGAAVQFAMTTGPTARAIRDAGDEAREPIARAIEARFRPLLGGDRVVLGGAVWLVRASR
jgi:SAM-dependent methyltransferase